MTGGPGAASGDRAARSREPYSGQSGPRPERPAEHSGPPGRGARDPEQLADPMDLVGPDGLDVPGVGPTTDPNVGGEPQAAILADVAGLTAERDEYLTALQRLQADFANYRKRVLRQQEEQSARAALDLVGKVLPVLDTLDLARAHLGVSTDAGVSEEARALDQARSQLLDVLAKEGLERVDQSGVEFDPTVHDAVANVPADAPADAPVDAPSASTDDAAGPPDAAGQAPSTDGDAAPPPEAGAPVADGPGGVKVDEVLRAGYRWRGQVLRPAMVRVRG
jgi:molecular chaperone GrpE